MAVLAPVAKMQFIDINGQPLVGGKLYTYAAGTTTPLATYTDNSGAVYNPNPIILDARGETNIWLGAAAYKFKLTDSADNLIWTVDYVSGPTSSISPVFSGNVTIESDSSNPALRVTQTGSGAALLIEDNTNPDATPFIVDASGRVGIGTLVPANALDVNDGTIQISSGGVARTQLYAAVNDSVMSIPGNRGFVFYTNGVIRYSINATKAEFTVPIQLPGPPSTSLQAATKAYVDNTIAAALPAGTIAPYAGSGAPAGWLSCAGAAVSRTTYAALFTAIGTTWGVGDGSTTFNLPDLRGAFLRGSGTSSLDPSSPRAVGSFQAEAYASHNHGVTDPGHHHGAAFTIGINGGGGGAIPYPNNLPASGQYATSDAVTDITINNSGGAETRPDNYAVLYIIKT